MNVTVVSKRVLIADADPSLRQSVCSFVEARGYLVDQTGSSAEAADLLVSHHIDVLVTDVAPDPSGIDLLAVAKRIAPSTRSIAIGRDLSRAEHDGATRLGAVRVLPKPLSLLDLGDAVDLAANCAEGFYGWLHGLSLPDVLQMLHMTSASLTLRVRGAAEGKLVFCQGEIVHAECEADSGRPALARLLEARRGQLETGPVELNTWSISDPFEHVVLDGLRVVDESRRRPSLAPLKTPSGEYSFAGIFDESRRRPSTRPTSPPLGPGSEPPPGESAPPPRTSLRPDDARVASIRQALADHSPGAFAWLCDLSAGAIHRVDEWESPADLGLALRAFAMALSLAGGSDPAWASVELSYGGFVVALVRRGQLVLAIARAAMGEELLRRFRVEVNRVRRYWLSEADC